KDPRSNAWVKRPLYDGMAFHRVTPDFLIQAGDPYCQNDPGCGGRAGTGSPGYKFQDEVDNGLRTDRPGTLAMANIGPDTNGSQFFILDKEAPWLTGNFTVFGRCADVDLVKQIAATERTLRDEPKVPVV